MEIRPLNDDVDTDVIVNQIHYRINYDSRFTCEVRVVHRKRVPNRITIHNIRLKEAKIYCGSHPYACDIEGGRKAKYLEGADWVEFNDRLNDILDRLEVSADVKSAVCILRKGTRRRTHYDGFLRNAFINEFQWHMDTHDDNYMDYCGVVAPASYYPLGTPGLYER